MCIYVEAGENDPESPTSPSERYATVYEINMIRCIFCGFCQEVCPTGALTLGPDFELAGYSRLEEIHTKEQLLLSSPAPAEA